MRRMRHLKPREIQGCQLALDASIATSLYDATSGGSFVAADGAVARWEDQSGNARHVTQSTGVSQPLRREAAANGQDWLDFDGSNDYLRKSTVDVLRNVSSGMIYTVIIRDDASSTNRIVAYAAIGTTVGVRLSTGTGISDGAKMSASGRRLDADASASISTTSNIGTSPAIITSEADWANTSIRIYFGTTQVASSTSWLTAGSTSDTSASGVYVGAFGSPSNYFPGLVGAVAFFGSAHANSVRRRMQHSLMRKWRING